MGYDERDCLIVSSPSSDIEEVLLELFARHISHLVVMESVVDASDVAGAVEHGSDVVAHEDDGTLAVEGVEHVVHLVLEALVDVGVGLVEYKQLGLGDDGAGEQHALQLSAGEGADGAAREVGYLHELERVVYPALLPGAMAAEQLPGGVEP